MTTAIIEEPTRRIDRRVGTKRHRGVRCPDGIPMQTTGHKSEDWCVSSFDLAEVIEPLMEELGRELSGGQNGDFDERYSGAIEAISGRVAVQLGVRETAVKRRLFVARKGESRAISAENAEAWLEAAADVRLEEVDSIPRFPGGVEAARDGVLCNFEFQHPEEEPQELEVRRLTRSLLNFTFGYLAGVNADIPTDTEEWARLLSGFRLDFYNRSYQGKLDPALRRTTPEPDAA